MASSISERCQSCISRLKSISSVVVDHPEQACRVNPEQARDNLERLSLWMGNIGACHSPKSPLSLESRLSDEGEVLDHIHELLEDLAEVAGELLEIITGDRGGASDFMPVYQEGRESKDEETELLEEIRGCITRLFRMSSLIRRAAPTDLFAKALSRDRYKFIDQFDIAHVGQKYPKLATEDLAWLRTRLGRAITQRRHYLSYIQDHRGKLEEVHQHDTNPESVIRNMIKEQHQDKPTTSMKLDLASRPSTFITKASSIQPGRITTNMLTPEENSDPEDDAKSYTTISRSVEGDFEFPITDRVPSLDELRQGRKNEVECPFCFRMKKFKNDKTWLKHVYSDLRSYVCTSSECEGLYFGDINKWFSHEMENHRVRYACQLCPNKIYECKDYYFAHIQKHHPSLLEHGKKDFILDIARRPLEEIPAQDCPCCSDWVARIRAERFLPLHSPVRVIPKIFKRHLASHLEQLALFAIPTGSMAAEADSNVAIEAAAAVPSPASGHSALEFASPNRSPASSQGHQETSDTPTSMAHDPLKATDMLGVQAMETSKTKLGADHPDTLTSMANLASTYRNQGRWEEAEELEVQVMETHKMTLGVDQPDTLTSMANLASIYWNQGRWEEAEELQVQVMETSKTKIGADHPNTLTSMANLGSTYRNQGRWEEAERLFMQVMEMSKVKLGADHPSTLMSMGSLAATYRNQGRWEEAKKLLMQVMETSKAKLGADHPDTLMSMGSLASTYTNQGRWEEAEKLFVQVMETREAKLGADHRDTLTSMANLASIYRNQGRWEEAETLEVQVMETSKTKLGADHPDTLTSMANLAHTWHAMGRTPAAIDMMRNCIHLQRAKLGPNHPHTQSSMSSLRSWENSSLI